MSIKMVGGVCPNCCMELTGGDTCKSTRKMLKAIQDALIDELDGESE